jgi:hypothetical protein
MATHAHKFYSPAASFIDSFITPQTHHELKLLVFSRMMQESCVHFIKRVIKL